MRARTGPARRLWAGLSTAVLLAAILVACTSGGDRSSRGAANAQPTAAADSPAVAPTTVILPTVTPPTAGSTPERPAADGQPGTAKESGLIRPPTMIGERARMLPRDRGAAPAYVALGDSAVEGLGASRPENTYVSRLHARLRSVYPEARVTNLGVGGATAADVVREQLPRAVALGPHLVTLSIGPNDVTQGRTVEAYDRDVDTIFRTLGRETPAVVVTNLLPDLAQAPRFSAEEKLAVGQRAAQFNEALTRRARQHGVEIVDLYAPSQQEVPDRPSLVSEDDYHPSDEGYARWAELMWRGVEARIESP